MESANSTARNTPTRQSSECLGAQKKKQPAHSLPGAMHIAYITAHHTERPVKHDCTEAGCVLALKFWAVLRLLGGYAVLSRSAPVFRWLHVEMAVARRCRKGRDGLIFTTAAAAAILLPIGAICQRDIKSTGAISICTRTRTVQFAQ